uniref:Uncharacterized protein n=1 Tax=Bosea sp. NBC_00436 TaxID=2969620 RepID=A0A9E7ZM14_9HYPH
MLVGFLLPAAATQPMEAGTNETPISAGTRLITDPIWGPTSPGGLEACLVTYFSDFFEKDRPGFCWQQNEMVALQV